MTPIRLMRNISKMAGDICFCLTEGLNVANFDRGYRPISSRLIGAMHFVKLLYNKKAVLSQGIGETSSDDT